MRTVLTMLGVVIGNSAFITMASLGESARLYTIRRIEDFHGPNRLIAYPTSTKSQELLLKNPKLYLQDALSLQHGAPAIKAVAPVTGETYSVQANHQSGYFWITGTTSGYPNVKNETIKKGRYFSLAEVSQKSAVVVLGSNVADKFFPNENYLGKQVMINSRWFRVIGVMASKGTLDKGSPDDFLYVPISSFSTYLKGSDATQQVPVDYIEISAVSKEKVPDAIFQATNILRATRNAQDFNISPNLPYLDLIGNVSKTLSLFLAVLAFISLTIGGIGIMNVMLVTVSERTSEIGLRKAVGARNSSILYLFLIESSLIAVTGSVFGVSIGLLVVIIISLLTPLPFAVPFWSFLVSLLLSSVVGVISGMTPARLAARLEPIRAIRHS